jgi:elongation factor P
MDLQWRDIFGGLMSYTVADLRKGLKIQIEGVPFLITEFTFMKPGKGQAVYTCRLKNLLNGTSRNGVYRSNESFDAPDIQEKTAIFSYIDGDRFVFSDSNFEELFIPEDVIGDKKYFLIPDMEVQLVFFNGRAIEVSLPNFVIKKVTYTENGVRGDTSTNVQKPATVEGGYEIRVPLFVNQDDMVKIDTRTGEYVDRVTQK